MSAKSEWKPGLVAIITASVAAGAAGADGVRVVSEEAPAELLAALRDAVSGEGRAATTLQARRAADRAAVRAASFLNSRGYFDPDIRPDVEPGDPAQPVLTIDPGRRFILGAVTVDFGGETPHAENRAAIAEAITTERGDPAIPQSVIEQETRLVAALKALGYADARALDRLVVGDRASASIDVTYRLHLGPRVRLGAVIFDDRGGTRRPYLERLVPFQSGVLYTPGSLGEFNRRLDATRLYASAAARLEPAAPPNGQADEVRPVRVSLTPRDRYTLSGGASLSTSEGPGVSGALTRRNATRRGDTLAATTTLASQQRALGVTWRIPNAIAYDQGFAFAAEAARDETDAFDREALTVTGAYEVRRSRRLTYALGGESEFTSERDALGQRDLRILSASAAARLDQSDDPLDPTRGWRADARLEPADASGDTSASFVTLDTQLSGYQPLAAEGRLVAAARVRAGFVAGAPVSDLPVSRRFFAGGGGSARGFAYQSVGPTDAGGAPVGGRGLLELSSELRLRTDGALGYVAFVDAASVSPDAAPSLDDVRFSAGVGVRYRTVVGPIRLDVATPLERQAGEEPVQIYVSLGQAF